MNFDLSWDNSWRTSTYESNWDAAWVFAKWRLKNTLIWNHASLNLTGHTAPTNAIIETPGDGKGVFIYKSTDTISSNTFTSAKLRWEYGVDGLQDNDSVEICVFAIEMVFIPQGAFYLGDGQIAGKIEGNFTTENTTDPFYLTSEAAITLGDGSAGSMGDNGGNGMDFDDDFAGGAAKILPAAFPKGYNAFYIMKYEISQEQYVEFLNKLTYTQQAARTAVAPSSATGTGALSNTFRNGIDLNTPGTNPNIPAVYSCNYNGNAIYNQAGDGQNIACNFMSWADLAAYLDWSGLRPFTELEYEKACRGSGITPFIEEYAWGDTTLKGAKSILYAGFNNETDTITGANAAYRDTSGVQGPMRVGCFAKTSTDRTYSGGAYYGAMDMSGNLWERIITVGNSSGRLYTGIHGDGSLDASGSADVTNWPASNALGVGSRGGGWESDAVSLRISSRYYSMTTVATRGKYYGGRGVRIAP